MYFSAINQDTESQTTMKHKIYTLLILLSATLLVASCGRGAKAGGHNNKPAVTIKTQRLSDKSAFTMSNGERCTIVADATIDYPAATGDGLAVDSLQRLFASYVLESGDTLSLTEAMRQVVANSMHQYDFMTEPMSADEAAEAAEAESSTLRYATSTRITPIFKCFHTIAICMYLL